MSSSSRGRDFMRLERETVIPVLKSKIISDFLRRIEGPDDRSEFWKLCRRVEYAVRAWYFLHFEEMMRLYSLFDPLDGARKLNQLYNSPEEIDGLEQKFLTYLFQAMEKSQFKIITNKEVDIATAANYLLTLPVAVDDSKLDNQLLSRFFRGNSYANLPEFSDKYVIFHRGMCIDRKTAYFVVDKLNMIISRAWSCLLSIPRALMFFQRPVIKPKVDHKKSDDFVERLAVDDLLVERIRVENLEISLKNLLRKTTVQEPTYDRLIVVYRLASKKREDRGIHIKHYKNIPFADLELVMPEKKNPSLTPMDWVKLIISSIIGLIALVGSLESPKDVWVSLAIVSAIISYGANILFTFRDNFSSYQNTIMRAMYEKQLDSGRGTLLHLCDDVIEQEVKEVIIAFFVLMEQGEANLEELDLRCEKLVQEDFGQKVNFDVDDAVHKLIRLGLVVRSGNGQIRTVELKRANEIIGTTTEEVVVKAKEANQNFV